MTPAATAAGHNSAVPVGYLASHYPAVSHTFVWREVEALRRRGVEVETFSIHRTPADELLSEADREAARTTRAVLPVSPAALLRAHAGAFARRPARYLSTLARALRLSAPGTRAHLWQLFYFAEAMVLSGLCRRSGVRHLHAQFADAATDVALLTAHYGGPGWSWSLAVHGPVEFYNVERYRLAEKLADARFAVAISFFGRSQLMTLVAEQRWSDLHVVRCGVDPAVYAAPERRDESQALRVLCVGRLVHLKGQSLLVRAIAELSSRGVDARLTLVGDGPRRAALDELARNLGVADRVHLAGSVGQDVIRDRYSDADVFCLPSFAEGLPVVLMEAMALELPVVTTPIAGVRELVEDGVSGRLVAPGELEPLVEALAELAADPQRRAEMGRAGRRRVLADYDVARSAAQMESLLADVA